jgi:hypothetical protein
MQPAANPAKSNRARERLIQINRHRSRRDRVALPATVAVDRQAAGRYAAVHVRLLR